MSESSTGPVRYRLQERPGSDKPNVIMVQIRRFFIYIDHRNVDNERRKAMLDVLEGHKQILDALLRFKEHEKDHELAKKKINRDARQPGFFRRWLNSKPWQGARTRGEDDLIDVTDEFKKLVKDLDLESWLKPGGMNKHHRGVTTVYYNKGDRPPDMSFVPDAKPHAWDTERHKRQNQNRKKGNQNQNNQSQN